MDNLVLLDSQILIWGIKGYATNGQENNIDRAKQFVFWLSENHYRIILPMPQLVELLSCVAPQNQNTIKDLFDKRFQIVPFDEMAALTCAELMYLSLNEPEIVKYRNNILVAKK